MQTAADRGSDLLYRYLTNGEVSGPVVEWSFAHLDRCARAVASALGRAEAGGRPVLLLYPPGLEFISAFLGCLYAGAIAVPAYPPDPSRFDRSITRLRAMAADSRAAFVLTTAEIAQLAPSVAGLAADLLGLRWIATDALEEAGAAEWRRPDIGPGTVAFLQYTSGSTGSPRGVIVTHANVLHNSRIIQQGMPLQPGSQVVGWLPIFHDMGLIGNVLQPLFRGVPCTLMSPLAFLQRPMRWLEAISHFGGTVSGGPNFAYELVVRKSTPEQRAALDLGRWVTAFNGSEPVRRDTLDRFVEAFAVAGFRREALYPCYGLAEATLFVSGGRPGTSPVSMALDAGALRRGRVQPGRGPGEQRVLVSSGRVDLGIDVIVVDPQRRVRVDHDAVGEIWVVGTSAAAGYWQRSQETEETFGARLATGQGPYLRTGDLGFVRDGELFVAGRLKDLIVVRGQNHYPQDVERTVDACQGGLRAGCSAAFSFDDGGSERVVVCAEMDTAGPDQPVDLAARIRERVASEHGLDLQEVVFLAPRSIPKTSSGRSSGMPAATATSTANSRRSIEMDFRRPSPRRRTNRGCSGSSPSSGARCSGKVQSAGRTTSSPWAAIRSSRRRRWLEPARPSA